MSSYASERFTVWETKLAGFPITHAHPYLSKQMIMDYKILKPLDQLKRDHFNITDMNAILQSL